MMADVTLAECDGQVWLVDGLEHLDDLLFNALPATATVEILPCATREEVWAMWQKSSGTTTSTPWVIHPGIVARIKGKLGDTCIRFTAWSAMVNDDGQAVIAGAAEWVSAHASGRLVLRQHRLADMPPGLADLQGLRGQLVAAALARAGADPARLDHETQHSDTPGDAERLDIVTITPTSSLPA